MPNPWKKKPPPLSRLLSAHGRGSLVVQPGFPTSIADILVKNRSRIRKPSRQKNVKPPDLDLDAPVTEIRPSTNALRQPRQAPPRRSEATFWGIRVLFVTLAVLIALAVERQKLLAGITVFAVGFRFFDYFGFRVLEFFKFERTDGELDCNLKDSNLNLDGRGSVSPIREVGIGRCLGDNDASSESGDVVAGLVECGQGTKRKKKLFRKFTLKKFRSEKESKDGKLGNSVHSVNSDSSVRGIEEEGAKEETDEEICDESAGTNNEIECEECFKDCGVVSRFYLKSAFFSIILLGLVGGKGVALVLTVSWFLLSKSSRFLWRRKKDCNV